MNQFQEIIYCMKTVRSLSEKGIIFTDEYLRGAGKKGCEAGKKLREVINEIQLCI